MTSPIVGTRRHNAALAQNPLGSGAGSRRGGAGSGRSGWQQPCTGSPPAVPIPPSCFSQPAYGSSRRRCCEAAWLPSEVSRRGCRSFQTERPPIAHFSPRCPFLRALISAWTSPSLPRHTWEDPHIAAEIQRHLSPGGGSGRGAMSHPSFSQGRY